MLGELTIPPAHQVTVLNQGSVACKINLTNTWKHNTSSVQRKAHIYIYARQNSPKQHFLQINGIKTCHKVTPKRHNTQRNAISTNLRKLQSPVYSPQYINSVAKSTHSWLPAVAHL